MIERNLGNIERVARLVMGVVFELWAVSQPYRNAIEWFVVAMSLMLVFNGIFSRCYFWYVLEINTCAQKGENCNQSSTCY